MPVLSILIVNWNTRDLLDKCLASIEANAGPDTETIVVDNASADGSAQMVRANHPRAILIEPNQNTGYAAGNNLAFAAAKGDYLLTLNPDTELNPQTLPAALNTIQTQPKCGCVSVKLIGTDGKTQRSIRGFPTIKNIVGEILHLNRDYRLNDFDYEKEQPAPQPMGTFLLFKREALKDVGDPQKPFDENFPIFFNEVDLLKRLHDKGWSCWYTPKGSLLHYGGESTKQVRKSMIWESHRSLVRYLRKHSGPAGRLGLNLLLPAIYGAALLRAKGYHGGFRA